MGAVFVDTAYLVAVFSRRDRWREQALDAKRRLGDVNLVTTDEVLAEFLSAMSAMGSVFRKRAANMVSAMLESNNPSVRVVPQTHQSFLDGLDRYERRLDKAYSLQDCISMNVMDSQGITDVLTSDHHFEQEGFTILIKSIP